MSDYSQVTNYTAKDALTTGDPEKIILGSDIDAELSAISTAIATKYDSSDRADQTESEATVSNTVLATPASIGYVLDHNAGMLRDIKNLADPNADTVLGWDDSAGAVIGYTLGTGLTFNGTQIDFDLLGFDALVDPNADSVPFWDDSAGAFAWLTFNEGLEFSGANTIGLTDVVAGAAQPVVITAGTFTFDLSSITEISGSALSQSADGYLISDAGVLKVLPLDEQVVPLVNAADAIQTFALDDAGTLQIHDSTTVRVWTIPANASVAFPLGTVILLQSIGTAGITITADGGVVMNSVYSTSAAATSDTIAAGGRGALIKVATDEWTLSGDIKD
jgi:hypothetical protein